MWKNWDYDRLNMAARVGTRSFYTLCSWARRYVWLAMIMRRQRYFWTQIVLFLREKSMSLPFNRLKLIDCVHRPD